MSIFRLHLELYDNKVLPIRNVPTQNVLLNLSTKEIVGSLFVIKWDQKTLKKSGLKQGNKEREILPFVHFQVNRL